MIRSGTNPVALDKEDLSYHGSYRKFGAIAKPEIPIFSVDTGKVMWDQEQADPPAFNTALPFGCTGMTLTDLNVDVYGEIFKPEYSYFKTCYMEGHPTNQGCDIRTALKSSQVYGLQQLSENSDIEAEQHRGGKYFNIYDDGGLDWYDGILTGIYEQKVGASLGSPWFSSWSNIGSDGILPMPTANELKQAREAPQTLGWHNWAAKGQYKEGNDFFIETKSHQGKNYGNKGFSYLPREVANEVFEIRGSAVYIQPKYAPQDLATIKLAILEYEIRYLLRMFGFLLN